MEYTKKYVENLEKRLERAERERDEWRMRCNEYERRLAGGVVRAEARAQKAEAVVEAARQEIDSDDPHWSRIRGALAALDAALVAYDEPPTEQWPPYEC